MTISMEDEQMEPLYYFNEHDFDIGIRCYASTHNGNCRMSPS